MHFLEQLADGAPGVLPRLHRAERQAGRQEVGQRLGGTTAEVPLVGLLRYLKREAYAMATNGIDTNETTTVAGLMRHLKVRVSSGHKRAKRGYNEQDQEARDKSKCGHLGENIR